MSLIETYYTLKANFKEKLEYLGVDFEEDMGFTTLISKLGEIDVVPFGITENIRSIVVWRDNNDEYGLRPLDIDVELYSNNRLLTSATVRSQDGWEYTFTLFKYYDMEMLYQIPYSLEFPEIEGYTTTVNGNVCTYNRILQTVSKTVSIIWDNKTSLPPSINVYLSNGSMVLLNSSNGWSGTITGLPKYSEGSEIIYYWENPSTPQYEFVATVNGDTTIFSQEPYETPL